MSRLEGQLSSGLIVPKDLVVAVAVLGQRNLWQEAIQQLRRERPAGAGAVDVDGLTR